MYISCISVEQSLFKQFVTGNKVLPFSSKEVAVFVHRRVL